MEKINISDLSVGDWVRVINQFDAQIDGYHSESGSLSLKTRQRNLVYYRLEDIHPIPITPEILEANGFSHNGKRWYTPELFTLEQWTDNWTIIIDCACGDYVCEVYTIKYIHQLQHALRLAGVEKEINL